MAFIEAFFIHLSTSTIMKRLFLLLFLTSTVASIGAQNSVTKESVAQAEKLMDIELNDAERDSLISQAQNYLVTYKAMHAQKLDNSVAPALYFNPSVSALNLSQTRAVKAVWDVPKNVELPKNKADLAFYSLPQLANLIQNRKISSVDLTRFFISRLKQYGDTLHCVISLTENIALAEAAQADADIAKGQYRGVLHGIP